MLVNKAKLDIVKFLAQDSSSGSYEAAIEYLNTTKLTAPKDGFCVQYMRLAVAECLEDGHLQTLCLFLDWFDVPNNITLKERISYYYLLKD